jgi:protoporphyrin/coproporphyrin ferrochelatase
LNFGKLEHAGREYRIMFKPAFNPEPPFAHGQTPRTAVLLCNLGTPDAPTASAVRRYLAEFLGDHRVVEIPRLLWLAILHGIILRVRPAKSAAKYATIWTDEGSPLKIWTDKQAQALQAMFNANGESVTVRYAMRYGNPAIGHQLDALKAEGFTRVLILPAYPQYSGTTTASVFDAVYHWGLRSRVLPEFRFINHYHDHPGYIQALAKRVRAHWAAQGQAELLVMSFHGVPERTLHLGDPYHCECYKTARLLGEALGLSKSQYKVTFQSRFGKAKWLEPYTEPTLIALAQQSIKRVDLICPGFTSDCLETLEEISQEAREAYLHAGGESFHYIPCLNDSQTWVQGMYALSKEHMGGWSLTPADANALATSRQEALALGAKN